MMFWVFYFITVVFLHLFQIISAHAFYNLFLCLFVFFPLPDKLPHKIIFSRLQAFLGLVIGIILLWHESYLPPIATLWQFITNPELRPSPVFLWRFILSEINLKLLLFIIPTITFAYFLSYTKFKKYFGLFFLACFFLIGFTEKASVVGDFTANFYQSESKKSIDFVDNLNNDFDIVILQLCSFSWDDFNYITYDIDPFLSQFDYIFTNFNTATSYSNPAVIRLLRSTCGQTTHEQLFSEVDNKCYLMNNLKNLGYSPYTSLNHNGVYSGFNEAIEKYGMASVPLSNANLKPIEASFDGTYIYGDEETLSSWLETRKLDKNKKTVLFYNSTTLHTGGRYLDSAYLSNSDQYRLSLSKIIGDLNNFFVKIKKSNKNTIVIVLGEHGAALRGSVLQPGTVREIPLPSITTVPVAIKLFGPGFNNDQASRTIIIDKPASYLAMSDLLSQIIKISPQSRADLSSLKITDRYLTEEIVSENENGVIVKNKIGLFYKLKKYKTWDIIPGSVQ